MFSLCKTIKIYHTVNHYHSNPIPKDPAEIRFEDAPTSKHQRLDSHTGIKMIQSHSLSPRKSRVGINLSLKDSSLSPSKDSEFTHYKNDLSHTNNNRTSSNSHGQQSQISSLKFRNFHRLDKEAPMIVQSKITYGQMSPRMKSKELMEELPSGKGREEDLPSEIPLIKVITGTTQLSGHSHNQKMGASINPLKKSTSFIRSSSKSRLDQSVKNSLIVDNSLNNTIDFKFSTYKSKRQDASESLLRLSCSSYTELLDKAPQNRAYQDFSQTCSLELKKQQSCMLNDYACEVNESIIINRSGIEKNLKEVKSNYDLFKRVEEQQDICQVHSIIIGNGKDSPVQKLKKRYGDNLLHPYDRQTIESKSFISRSQNGQKTNQIIDESYIIQHEIEDKFIPLKGSEVNRQQFRMFLALERTAKMLVSIKQVPVSSIHKVNQELSIYREIETHSLDISVLNLYQMYTHGNIFVMVKEPYELTLQDFIDRHAKDFVIISWEFIIKNIEETLLKTIGIMKKRKMQLSRLVSAEDIVKVFGEWKLHTPALFTISEDEYVQDRQALQYLREEIMSRIRNSHNHN